MTRTKCRDKVMKTSGPPWIGNRERCVPIFHAPGRVQLYLTFLTQSQDAAAQEHERDAEINNQSRNIDQGGDEGRR